MVGLFVRRGERKKEEREASEPGFSLPLSVMKDQTMLQAIPFRVNAVGELLLPFQEPLKPGADERVAPGAMVPLYERLVMVTLLPDWV